MSIVLGPVIGHTSDEEIRVLLEMDVDCEMILVLQKRGEPRVRHETRRRFISHRPSPFVMRGVAPGHYDYHVETCDGIALFSADLMINDVNRPLEVIVVSCNEITALKMGQVDMWDSMCEQHLSQRGSRPDFILHIGDQVYEYIRDVWERSYKYVLCLQEGNGETTGQKLMDVDESLGYSEWETEPTREFDKNAVAELITELFRSLYRQTWNHAPQREIMSKVSNHMILDDHDIRNGWGILDADRQIDTIEYMLGRCAHLAYQEYQVQLWKEIDGMPDIDCRVLKRGKTAIFLADLRNPRTFHYQQESPYVGRYQMNMLIDLLSERDIRDLMFVCSVPIIEGSEIITSIASMVDASYDVRDSWCSANHRQDHFYVLKSLESWKRRDRERNVLLVGGDIHMAMESEIRSKEDGILLFTQVVTSPITNVPLVGVSKVIQDVFMGNSYRLYNQYDITNKTKVHARNYLHVKNTGKGWDYQIHYDGR